MFLTDLNIFTLLTFLNWSIAIYISILIANIKAASFLVSRVTKLSFMLLGSNCTSSCTTPLSLPLPHPHQGALCRPRVENLFQGPCQHVFLLLEVHCFLLEDGAKSKSGRYSQGPPPAPPPWGIYLGRPRMQAYGTRLCGKAVHHIVILIFTQL